MINDIKSLDKSKMFPNPTTNKTKEKKSIFTKLNILFGNGKKG